MNQKESLSITIVLGIVLVAGIVGYLVFDQRTTTSPVPTSTPTPAQTPTTNPDFSTITVSLGQEFTLKKGETARVKDSDVFLRVKDFIYSPCPRDSQCIWNGMAVIYEISVEGKIYNVSTGSLPQEVPYDVFIKNTNYKTYATFVINAR